MSNELFETLAVDDHIMLRQLALNEARNLFSLVGQNRDYLKVWLPWVDATLSSDDSIAFIETTIRKRLEGSEYGYGIFFHDVLCGHISLMHVDDGQEPEIGYWIANAMSGQGIMTEAAKAMTDFGLKTIGLQNVTIKADVKNIPSNKVAQKLGYRLVRQDDSRPPNVLNIWEKISG